MDYIDWIISSFVFLLMVSLVLLTIFNIIPINQKDDFFSRSIFISTLETVPTYNISLNSSDSEIYPYSFIIDNNYGISQNIFAIEGNNYYGIIKDNDQFFEYNFTEPSETYGIRVLKESFNDYDYTDNFTINPEATINSGILVLEESSTMTTDENYFDYFGFLSTTNAVNVYVSYTDINNNYFCRFGDSSIAIGKTENSVQTILETTSYSKETDWQRVFFGYTKDNLINCNAGNTETSYQDENIIPKTQIVISTIYNNTLLDDFYIYLNNDLSSDSNTSLISGNYIDANFTNNLATINLADNNLSTTLDFNFDKNLVVSDYNGISFVKNSEEENKILFFPQTKEFWGYKDSDENIEINLDNNTGLDLDISEIEDPALWFDASTLDLNDDDLVASWTDLSGNDYHATQGSDGNKPTFKENILNGKSVVRFDGTSDFLDSGDVLDMGLNNITVFGVLSTENTGNLWWLSKSKAAAQNYRYALGLSNLNIKSFMQGNGGSDVIPLGNIIVNTDAPNLLGYEYKRDANVSLFVNGTYDTGAVISQWQTADMQSNNPFRIGAYTTSDNIGTTSYYAGDLAEIIYYQSILSNYDRLLVENYLSQKYAIDVENGLSFTDNSIELINLNNNSKIMKIEFFDKETNEPVDCNYEYKNKKITINSCETDVIIKTRFRLNGVATFPEYPKVSITKTIEQVITKEKFDTLSNQSYYIRLFNNTLNLENRTNRPSTNFYKNFTKLLWSNGFLEEVAVEIKN